MAPQWRLILLGDGPFPGLTPKSRAIVIHAFHTQRGTNQIDTFDLVSAMDSLIERRVAVFNLSLAGPANEILHGEGPRAQARGAIVVAASGNDGAAARPRYPAAYPWATATTAASISATSQPTFRQAPPTRADGS